MNSYKKNIFACLCFLIIPVTHAMQPEPVLYYDFDDTTIKTQHIVTDKSGNNLHSVLADTDTHGSPTQTLGYQGSGLTFNGSNLLKVGDHSLLDLNHYTAMAWVKYSNFSGNDGRQEIYEKVHAYWMNILKGSGRLRVGGVFGACNGNNRRWIYVDSLTAINTNTWTHVAANYNGNTLKIYINGQLDAQVSASGVVCDNDQPLTLGAKHHLRTRDAEGRNLDKPVAFMKGTVDEFRLYPAALSQTQISQIMNQATSLTLAASITSPDKDSTVSAPVSVSGAASAPAKISQVLVGIKDNQTNKWWRNGSWGGWRLNPAQVTISNSSQTRATWTYRFDPRTTAGSGDYWVVVRSVDQNGVRSNPVSQKFKVRN